MATHITLSKVGALSSYGGVQVPTKLIASKTITPSGTKTDGGVVTPAGGGYILTVETGDEAIYFAFGGDPDPTTDPRWRLGPGKMQSYGVETGDTVSILAAS